MAIVASPHQPRFRSAPGRRPLHRAVKNVAAGRRADTWPTGRAAPAPNREGPLSCLAGGDLAGRFHGWRGASGKRYVCSVFPVRKGEALGGLPEFDGAIALAVGRDARGERRKIAVLDLDWRDGRFAGDLASAGDALRAGAGEWHIHLLAGDRDARDAAIVDIASLGNFARTARRECRFA